MSNLDEHGFDFERAFLSTEEQEMLGNCLGRIDTAGRRGILSDPMIKTFALSTKVLKLLNRYSAKTFLPIRAIYFDKSPDANWSVAWHQDLTIAVQRQIDVLGYGPWSLKDGVVHVQPPVEVLEQMVTARFHLDPADQTNGALKVIPGSHVSGKLSADEIRLRRAQTKEVLCAADAGDVLLMRPLLLHSSSRSSVSHRRRVLHIEYAGCQLPGGLEWYRW